MYKAWSNRLVGISDYIGSRREMDQWIPVLCSDVRWQYPNEGLPPGKIPDSLWSDKYDLGLKTPGVYSIPCECGQVYTGQTGRSVQLRPGWRSTSDKSGRRYPQEDPWYSSVRGWVDPRTIVRLEGLCQSKKKFNDFIGNRTRDLDA
jgi:hypothetical protein